MQMLRQDCYCLPTGLATAFIFALACGDGQPLVTISLDAPAQAVSVGDTVTVRATVVATRQMSSVTDPRSRHVEWSVANPSAVHVVAATDSTYTFLPLTAGSFTIRFGVGVRGTVQWSDSASLSVGKRSLVIEPLGSWPDSVWTPPQSLVGQNPLAVVDTYVVRARLANLPDKPAPPQLLWQTSPPKTLEIARVANDTARVIGITPGPATITVSINDARYAATALQAPVVVPTPCKTVSLQPAPTLLLAAGGRTIISAVALADDGATLPYALHWSTTDNRVVAPLSDFAGIIFAVNTGTAQIRVACRRGQTQTQQWSIATDTVHVRDPVLTVLPTNLTLERAQIATLFAAVKDQQGNRLLGLPVIWMSLNPVKVLVDTPAGEATSVIAVDTGSTVVRATAGMLKVDVPVTVTRRP